MKSRFHSPLAALGLLAFLSNCATTVKEKEKPSNISQSIEMPAVSDARRPDSTGAASTATDARTTGAASGIAATPATAVASDAASAAALAADRVDPNALSATAEPRRLSPDAG
jgi:hypothetical protein